MTCQAGTRFVEPAQSEICVIQIVIAIVNSLVIFIPHTWPTPSSSIAGGAIGPENTVGPRPRGANGARNRVDVHLRGPTRMVCTPTLIARRRHGPWPIEPRRVRPNATVRYGTVWSTRPGRGPDSDAGEVLVRHPRRGDVEIKDGTEAAPPRSWPPGRRAARRPLFCAAHSGCGPEGVRARAPQMVTGAGARKGSGRYIARGSA